MRDLTPVQATTTLQTFWQTFNGGVVEAVAELVKQTVGILYLEELAHPEAIGQKIDGEPEGLIDLCRGASVIACSIAGLHEPDPETEAVILEWWTGFCKYSKDKISKTWNKESGTVSEQRLLPYIVENVRRYGRSKTKLQRKMDTISNRALRRQIKK